MRLHVCPFVSCNVEKSIGFSLIPAIFDSLETQSNAIATDLWMKSFIDLDCAMDDKASLIKPSTSSKFTCGNEWTSILCSLIYKRYQGSNGANSTKEGALEISDNQINRWQKETKR